MALFKDVTRGGQIGFHFISMFRQINHKLKFPSLLLAVLIAGYLFYEMPRVYLYDTFNYSNAYLWENMPRMRKHIHPRVKYIDSYGKIKDVDALNVIRNWTTKHNMHKLKEYSIMVGYFSLGGVIGMYILAMILFKFLGGHQRKSKIVKGEELVAVKQLVKQIKKDGKCSELMLGELPIIKNSETNHFFVTGTTGSGKSNCIKSLIKQLRDKKQKMIIVDTSGEYVDFCYEEKYGDKILSPFDPRSETWNMWEEFYSKFDIDSLAETLFPNDRVDKFWSVASQVLFKSVLNKIQKEKDRSYERLFEILAIKDSKTLSELVEETPAAPYFEKNNEKTLLSIRSSMIPNIQFLEHLQEIQEESFSIKNWIRDKDETGILFLLCSPKQRKTMAPLFTIWMDVAVNNIMELGQSQDRRIWFVIDELSSLKKLPALSTMLSEVRKYGGCGIIGTQSIYQITEIYGHNTARSILDLLNTKIFFRSTEPFTQEWIVKSLGEQEEDKSVENYSYGANTMRDGVSLTKHTKVKQVILASELKKLSSREGFVQLPSGYPITKVTIPLTTSIKK